MRNDALDELDDDLSSLTSEHRATEGGAPPPRTSAGGRALWALVALLALALAGLGWWSQARIAQLAQQLVATQESFARISEDAAGQLKDISGQVVATESNVISEREALKLRIRQLESRVAELARREQAAGEQLAGQVRLLERLRDELQRAGTALTRLEAAVQAGEQTQASLQKRVEAQGGELAALQALPAALERLEGRLQGLSAELQGMKKQDATAQAVERLEAELLVLRSQLDGRAAPSAGPTTAEFDAFRAEMRRTLGGLQAQLDALRR